MTKTLTKHGNSYALILDKPILDLLKITPETPLNISTDGKTLFIGPTSETRQGKFGAALDDTVTQYARMLKRLSE